MSFTIFDKIYAVNQIEKVEPHASKMEALANDLERDGIGCAVEGGHVSVLRCMASDLRSQAATGRLAHSFRAQAEPAKLHPATVSILSQLGV
jgi:hypothetical protein